VSPIICLWSLISRFRDFSCQCQLEGKRVGVSAMGRIGVLQSLTLTTAPDTGTGNHGDSVGDESNLGCPKAGTGIDRKDQCKTNQTNGPLAVGKLQQDTKVIQSSDLSPTPS
jgi:hypothetical protein